MQNLRPNSERARNAIILIWCVLVLEIASLVSGYLQYDLLQTAANGGFISAEMANSNDAREQIIAWIYTACFITSAVTFILWFRRAYFNLHQKVEYLSYTEGWAAGCWFVPILNWFRPFQIMNEMYKQTKEFLLGNEVRFHSNFTNIYLGWWWTLWLISSVIGQIVFRSTMNAVTIPQLSNATLWGMVDNIIGIPLALITIKVIKDYTSVEPLLLEIEMVEEIAIQ